MTQRSVHRQRNDGSRTVGLGSTRYRHIPADGRRERVSNHPTSNCRGFGSGLSLLSLRGGSSPGLREGDRLSPRLVATHSSGGPEGERFAGAPLYRPLNLPLQIEAHAVQSYLPDLPKHVSRLSSAAGFDAQQHDLRGVGSAQIRIGENQNDDC